MKIFGLIPVKKISNAKKRLIPVLTSKERMELSIAMFQDVLSVVKNSILNKIIVISSDTKIKQIADKSGVHVLPDIGGDLNYVLEYYTKWCIDNGADATLILPSDIPLIKPEEINQIINLSIEKSIVISKSNNGGTNALLRNPPNIIPVLFGEESFKKHIKNAIKIGASIKIYQSLRFLLDIDSLEEIKLIPKLGINKKLSIKLIKKIKNKIL